MEKIKAFCTGYLAGLDDTVSTTRRTVFLEILAGILGGIVLGMLIAPARYVKMGCGNGNNNIGKCESCGCDGECGCEGEKEEE